MAPLPPGQRAIAGPPPRFGLFLDWKPDGEPFALSVEGDVETPLTLDLATTLGSKRSERLADLHCVSTWSAMDLRWSGRPFREFWEEVVVPRAKPSPKVAFVRARGLDGHKASLPLDDVLADGFLADTLNGEPIPHANGAPLRLVLPAHYGYKNVKHLGRLEFTVDRKRETGEGKIVHPRGRVSNEERNFIGPQIGVRWILKGLRPFLLWRAAQRERK